MRTLFLVLSLALAFGPRVVGASSNDDSFLYEENPAVKSSDPACCRLLLTSGEDKVVDLDFKAHSGAAGVSIGNPQILATTLVRLGDAMQLAIKPLREGSTTISVRDETGQLKLKLYARVLPVNLFRIAAEIREILRKVPGPSVRVAGARIVIEGEAASVEDWGKIHEAYAPHSTWVANLATVSQKYFDELARRAEAEIRKFAPDVRARAVGDQLWLEGKAPSAEASTRATQVASLFLPESLPETPVDRDPLAKKLPPRSHVQNFVAVEAPH